MRQILRKELLHIIRDKGLMIFILYAFSLDIYVASQGFNLIPEMISISVYDEDRSDASRELVSRIQLPAFRSPIMLDDRKDVDTELNESRSVISLVIPSGFQRDVHRGTAAVQVLVDGTQSAAAYLSSAYLSRIILAYSEEGVRENIEQVVTAQIPRVEAESRILFNPAARDDYFEAINEFFMVITLIGMILPAALLIREREYGTLEQIMISPISIHTLLISKIGTAAAFLIFAAWLCYEGTIKLWLGIPVKGSATQFLFASALYALATSGLSLIIASVARRFSQIGMLTIAIFAPMLLLSGGWVPPEALPGWLRKLTVISPLKHFMELGIGVLIRGARLEMLLPSILKLSGLGVGLLGAGYFLYRRRVLRFD